MKGLATYVGEAALGIILTLVAVANGLAGIVSGIWLAVMWEWWAIGLGFALGLTMPTGWTIVSLPSLGLAVLLVEAVEKRKMATVAVLGFVVSFYESCIILAWTASVCLLFAARAAPGTLIPLLIWGFATVMSPLAYMASHEPPDDSGSGRGLLLAHVGYLVSVVLFLCEADWSYLVLSLLGLAGLSSILSVWLVVALAKESGLDMTAADAEDAGQQCSEEDYDWAGADDLDSAEQDEDDLDEEWDDDQDLEFRPDP